MADDRKNVELHITGKDDSGPAARSAAAGIGKVTEALNQQAVAARQATEASAATYNRTADDLYKAQEAALKARREFEAFYRQMEAVQEPTKGQQREFDALAKRADAADKKVNSLTASLARADEQFRRTAAASSKASSDASYVKDVTAAVGQAEEQQRRLAALTAFRATGTQAMEGAQGLNAFTAAGKQADTVADGLATSIRSIVDPSGAARASLAGLESEVSRVVGVVGNADKPIRDYQGAINDLGRIQSDLLRQAGDVDAYKRQQQAVERASAAYEAARVDVVRYAQAVSTADEPNDQLAASLVRAEANMATANRELDLQKTRLDRLRAPLDAAKIDVNNLAAAETKLKTAAELAAGASAKLEKAMSPQGSKAGRFLGLRPYEIQNLGFQINDVFTQLASGASVTQTFAQQGGQILQLFPGMFARIAAFAPQLTAVLLVAGTTFAAIKRILDEEATVKQFAGELALSADGARYNAEALAANAAALDTYGTSLKNARAEISLFVHEGLDPALIERYGVAAQNLADITGKEVPDAAKQMADAFTGGWDQVKKLDDSINFLTASEAEHLRAQFESGDAAGARTEAFRIFEAAVDDAARKSRTEWSESTRSLTNSWDRFLETIGNTQAITDTIAILHGLVDLARAATESLDGVARKKREAGVSGGGDVTPPGMVARTAGSVRRSVSPGGVIPSPMGVINQAADAVDRLVPVLRALGIGRQQPARPGPAAPARPGTPAAPAGPTQAQAKAEAELTRQYQDQRDALTGLSRAEKIAAAERRVAKAEADARRKGAAENLNNEQISRLAAFARQTEQAKIDRETAREDESKARKGAAAARKDASEERAAEAKRQSLEAQLLNDQRNMEARIARSDKTDLPERLAAIDLAYEKIFDTLKRFKAAGGTEIDGQSIDAYTARIDANKELLKQQETLGFYEESIKSLTEQRAAALARIVERQQAGEITSEQAYAQAIKVQEELTPAIAEMAENAVIYALSISGAKPSPEMLAFLEKMRLAGTQARTGGAKTPAADVGTGQLSTQERELNAIISERNTLIATTNDLVAMGAITHAEGQARIQSAYAKTAPLIAGQVEHMRGLLDMLKETGVITPLVYDAWIAKLQQVNAQSVYLDENFTKIKQTAEGAFVQGLTDAVHTVGTAIGEAINGTGTWEDAITSLGRAAANFAITFLQSIADILLQIAALKLVQSLPFFDSLTKGIMDFTGLAAGATTLGVASGALTTAGATVTAGGTLITTGAAALTASGTSLAASSLPLLAAAAALSAAAAELAAAATIELAASSVGLFHSGGVVGSVGGRSRSVSPSIFAGAPRYHNGTVVGLRPDEQAAILKKNEEVLTDKDPRNILNGGLTPAGGAGRDGLTLKVINAIDAGHMVQEGLKSRAGERAVMNFIGANVGEVKKMLGS